MQVRTLGSRMTTTVCVQSAHHITCSLQQLCFSADSREVQWSVSISASPYDVQLPSQGSHLPVNLPISCLVTTDRGQVPCEVHALLSLTFTLFPFLTLGLPNTRGSLPATLTVALKMESDSTGVSSLSPAVTALAALLPGCQTLESVRCRRTSFSKRHERCNVTRPILCAGIPEQVQDDMFQIVAVPFERDSAGQ